VTDKCIAPLPLVLSGAWLHAPGEPHDDRDVVFSPPGAQMHAI